MSLHSFTYRDRTVSPPRRQRDPSSPWHKGLRWLGVVGLSLVLAACSTLRYPERADWGLYQNERYDFTFLYPDTWIPGPVLDNLDGRAFRDPEQEAVSIRGWASQVSRPATGADSSHPPHQISPNFTTDQGVQGRLQVEIGQDVSTLQLTLIQAGVIYYWEGRSPSNDFDDYFKFFYYVAQHYQIEPLPKTP